MSTTTASHPVVREVLAVEQVAAVGVVIFRVVVDPMVVARMAVGTMMGTRAPSPTARLAALRHQARDLGSGRACWAVARWAIC